MFTVSDIRATPERYPRTTIFPDNQEKFSKDKIDTPYFPPESPEEITTIVWFGFIVRYMARQKEEGEYGILGSFHRTRITSWSEPTQR